MLFSWAYICSEQSLMVFMHLFLPQTSEKKPIILFRDSFLSQTGEGKRCPPAYAVRVGRNSPPPKEKAMAAFLSPSITASQSVPSNRTLYQRWCHEPRQPGIRIRPTNLPFNQPNGQPTNHPSNHVNTHTWHIVIMIYGSHTARRHNNFMPLCLKHTFGITICNRLYTGHNFRDSFLILFSEWTKDKISISK